MTNPYYSHQGIAIYHSDCREIMPELDRHDAIITDPVWPYATANIPGKEDPFELLREASAQFPRLANRTVIQLGCDSDPRILAVMPEEMKFFRVCWLEYARPNYKGRLMNGSDVAYAFGDPIPWESGATVIPGRTMATDNERRRSDHPCARKLEHVKWLVRWFARGAVLDPFMGSGTTLLAAKRAGLPATGIEIKERYCEAAAKRLAQDVFEFDFREEESEPYGIEERDGAFYAYRRDGDRKLYLKYYEEPSSGAFKPWSDKKGGSNNFPTREDAEAGLSRYLRLTGGVRP